MKKIIEVIPFIVLLSFTSNAPGVYVTDNFNSTHDYLIDGTAGTIWDGFIGLGDGETVNALNANITQAGRLYMESTGASWDPPFNPKGPFLYKIVEGDFIATVYVADCPAIQWNDVGIMARVPNLSDAGDGEDFECVDYFPVISANMVRAENNGSESEVTSSPPRQYLRLRLEGNTFYHEASSDGTNWTLLNGSPRTRDDMAGLALQVGLQHANYTSSTGYVAYDDLSITPPQGEIIITETGGATEVYESGDPPNDTYTVALSQAPASNVTINIYHDDLIEVVPDSLVFTSLDYANPKTVTVSAFDNPYPDGEHVTNIIHETSTGDPAFQFLSVTIDVTIYDNDRLADFIKDGYINVEDLEFLLDRWLEDCLPDTYCDGTDLSGLIGQTPNPGTVDAKDLAIFASHWLEGPLLISEFMASNNGYFRTQTEGNWVSPDWIEIYNASPYPMDLNGWYLSDNTNNLEKWPFPDIVLYSGQYLIVFASGQDVNDYVDDLGFYHTNFQLDAAGEFLALVAPGGTIAYRCSYPEQKTNCSYGIKDQREGYFAVPTPGTKNGDVYSDYVRDTKFSKNRGFYDQEFDVAITTDTPDATIRYTIDGSEPDMTNGFTYSAPVNITHTTCLRAAAFKDDYIPTDVDTQTYIFLNDIWTQTRPDGYPTQTYDPAYPLDYDIDQDVIGPDNLFDDVYRNTFIEDLKCFPSLSIVMNIDDLFGLENGIYANSVQEGELWERTASLEQIDPIGDDEFQVNMAIRMQGGYGANAFEQPKHNFRFIFKWPYGPTKLDYKLFDDTNVDSFDQLVLRTPCHDSWLTNQYYCRREGLYMKDRWHRAIQRAMGHVSIHGKWVHLYLNGLYWGIYELVERPTQDFAASYFGGEKEQYDAIGSGTPRGDSTLETWNEMFSIADGGGPYGSLSNNDAYEHLQDYLDVVNLADYIIYNVYSAISDWPGWNYYAAKKKTYGEPFRFFSWDSEASMMSDRLYYNKLPSINDGPGHLYTQLKLNAEFRLLMADRLYRHVKNDGVLTPAKAAQYFQAELDGVEQGLGPESARWGDSWETIPLTKADWLADQQFHFDTFFPQRNDIVLGFFYDDGVYPDTDAPYFNQHGGQITPPFYLTITNPNGSGTIYYTLDGSDPREQYTGNILGTPYSGPITLNETTLVKARVKDGSEWSALCEAVFETGMVVNNLRITEIMYHPQETGDPNDPNEEFIELQNIGTQTINLNMAAFTEGINFIFPDMQLAAGEFVVLVKDLAAFEAKYGTAINVAGQYEGKLANEGERIRLQDALGQTVLDFEYKDGWCDNTDGEGYSLTINDQTNPDPNSWAWQRFWSASTYIGGSPGSADNGPRWGDVVINEVLAHSDGYPDDWVELHNTTTAPIDITGWFLSDDANDLAKYQIPAATIPANGFVIFTQADDFGASFGLSEYGETVYLTGGLDGFGNLTGYRQKEGFDASENNVAFGRHYKASTDDYDFIAMSNNTPGPSYQGAENAYPKVGPIVISEVMYNPPLNPDAEYIELYNISGSTVNLYDSNNNGWSFTNGITFIFPAGTTLASGSYMLLVKDIDAFNSVYSAPPGVQLLQWTDGGLNNEGEKLEISTSGDYDEYGTLHYIRIDRVNYSDGSQHQNFYNMPDPWPARADGTGYSLTRINYSLYGNDANSWSAYPSSPGQVGSPPTPPSKATNPEPANGATEQPTALILSWSNGGGAISYDVYFGTDSTPDETEFKVNTTGTIYDPGQLLDKTTYYWRINAKNLEGTATGDVWSFTTLGWTTLTYDDFESGWGNYISGGIDAFIYTYGGAGTNYAHQGSKAADIQDDTVAAASFEHTSGIDVHTPGYTQIKIQFWFYSFSMETAEDFFVWYYNGTTWLKIATYVSGTDFVNSQFYQKEIILNEGTYNFPTNMKIKFECSASGDGDDIYIDEVRVLAK